MEKKINTEDKIQKALNINDNIQKERLEEYIKKQKNFEIIRKKLAEEKAQKSRIQQIWQRKNTPPGPVNRYLQRRQTTTIYATAPFVRYESTVCAASLPAIRPRNASSCIPSTLTIHNCRVLIVHSTVTTNRYACPAASPPSTTTCQAA